MRIEINAEHGGMKRMKRWMDRMQVESEAKVKAQKADKQQIEGMASKRGMIAMQALKRHIIWQLIHPIHHPKLIE